MGMPTLFSLDVYTNLVPTFEFIEQCIGTEEARALLTKSPRLFSCSLEGRLKPRLEEAKKCGNKVNSGLLRRIALYTEARWRNSVTYQTRKSTGKLASCFDNFFLKQKDGQVISCVR